MEINSPIGKSNYQMKLISVTKFLEKLFFVSTEITS